MRVEYRTGFRHWQSEWICLEHTGYARHKAEAWWKKRSGEPVPDTAEEAVAIAEEGGLAQTLAIQVKSVAGEKYDRIIGYQLGEKPHQPGWDDESSDKELEPANAWDDGAVPF